MRKLQNIYQGEVSRYIPKNSQTGAANFAADEPVIAKTSKIIISWKLESIPQRSFNLFIVQIYHITGQLKKT